MTPRQCMFRMAEPGHIAVFDVGKTSSKIVLLDGVTLKQIDVTRIANVVAAGPPYPHIDSDAQWGFLCAGLAAFQSKHGVDAVAITTHGATAALVDERGLVLPVLDYEFEIPESDYDQFRPAFDQTYSPNLPNGLNLGAQIYYQKSALPAAFSKAKHILTFPQYWCWRLTGEARSECTSLGTHTDLWRPESGVFSAMALEMFPGLFPALAPAGETYALTPEAARQTGLKPGTPVTCGIHDSNASLLPWLDAGEALSVISSGTWTIVMSLGGSLESLDPDRDMLANVDAYGRPVPTARFMGGREFDLLTRGANTPFGMTDAEAVISDNIHALPGQVQGVGPFPNAPGGWSGNAPEFSAQRMAAATLYLALMSQTCLDLSGATGPIVIEGPFAGNRLYAQILSALTQRSVHLSSDATGTATGAAMLISSARGKGLGAAVVPAKLAGLEVYADNWRMLARQGDAALGQ